MRTHLSMNLWGKSRVIITTVPRTSQPLHTSIVSHSPRRWNWRRTSDTWRTSLLRSTPPSQQSVLTHTHTTEWKSKDPSVSPVSHRRLARAAVSVWLYARVSECVARAHEKLTTDTNSLHHSTGQRSTLQSFARWGKIERAKGRTLFASTSLLILED